jgi:hypothetical protein
MRERDLPKLLSIPHQVMTDLTIAGQRKLVARLLRLTRHSARPGKAGHWSYDTDRHVEMLGMDTERAALAARLAATCRQNVPPIRARSGIST